jgi:hypothetical protein
LGSFSGFADGRRWTRASSLQGEAILVGEILDRLFLLTG